MTSKVAKAINLLFAEGPVKLAKKLIARVNIDERIALRHARSDAEDLSRRLAASGKRGLFIDCGSNIGQGFTTFERIFPLELYDFVLIEPNPNCTEALRAIIAERGGNIELVSAAAATECGEITLFGLVEDERGAQSQGASTLSTHNSLLYQSDAERAISVPKFSLAQFIMSKAKTYDIIAMKLDIEGAEYGVLRDLLDTGAAALLSTLYVEFHSRFMVKPERAVYRTLEDDLTREFRLRGLLFRQWV